MRTLTTILLFSFLLSCSKPAYLPLGEYIHWVEQTKNGLHKEKVIGNIKYEVQYRPIDYICAKENSLDNPTRRKELGDLQYYEVRISLNGSDREYLKTISSSPKDYLSRIGQFEFSFKDQIKMVQGNDSLPCAIYHYQNYNGLAPFVDLLIGFNPVKSSTADRTLLIDDNISGTGPVFFNFSSDVFQNLPHIKAVL